MRLVSPAFPNESEIPVRYTSDGDDASPPLAWSDLPPGTKSLALVVDDPDAPDPAAPKTRWVHWVIVDMPPDTSSLAEDATGEDIPHGAREGTNDWGNVGWGGPAPPIGTHRYVFTLYALDTTLPTLVHPRKAELERAMRGHVIDQAVLVGVYGTPSVARRRRPRAGGAP